jgi:hypothetical protein
MCEPSWWFQTGWSSGAGRDGVRSRLREVDVKESGDVVIEWLLDRGPAA